MSARHTQLLSLLDQHGELSVVQLSQLLGASEATIRRDLSQLQDEQLLTRTFGGAQTYAIPSLVLRTFAHKRETMRQQKEAIARLAATLVQPGSTVAIDSGTTAWRVAHALCGIEELTIVTTAMAVVEELGPCEGITVHLAGGEFRLANLDFVGPAAVASLKSFRTDLAILSADAVVPGHGAYSLDTDSAAISQSMADTATSVMLVADSAKFQSTAPHLILPEDRLDTLISDDDLSDRLCQRYTSSGMALKLAKTTSP